MGESCDCLLRDFLERGIISCLVQNNVHHYTRRDGQKEKEGTRKGVKRKKKTYSSKRRGGVGAGLATRSSRKADIPRSSTSRGEEKSRKFGRKLQGKVYGEGIEAAKGFGKPL